MTRKRKRHRTKPKIESKLLDIVIPVYRRFDLLEKCLSSIPDAAVNIRYNIIIVDNNSPREEADPFYNQYNNLVVIRNKENFGFPKACNQGVRRKASPLIFLLNSDVILEPNSIDLLVRALDDPKIGVVGMKLLFPEDHAGLNPNIRPAGKVQHVGLATNIQGDFFHIFLGWDADHPKVNATKEVYAVTGAALMTRRSIWNKVGGFFEGYGAGTFEDVDFCLSVRDIGYNIIVETRAVGTHYVGATAEKYQLGYPLQMNRLLLFQRWATKFNYTEYLHW